MSVYHKIAPSNKSHLFI